MTKEHDKVKIIVEETVQRVYLLDPDSRATLEFVEGLKGIVTGQLFEGIPMAFEKNPPAVLGHRAKKGAVPPALLRAHPSEVEWRRLAAVTIVIPDEHGNPSLEQKFTPTTVTQKPVTK